MVVVHGYHDSQWRRMEREGAGGIQSLLRIAKAFDISLSALLNGLGEYPKAPLVEIEEKKEVESRKTPSKKRASAGTSEPGK